MNQRRYSMEDEIYRALNCRAAAAELPSAINEMTVAAWDALIAAGRAALQAALTATARKRMSSGALADAGVDSN